MLQSRSERTHGAILDAAQAIISAKGYDAASVNEISRKAGVTSGALYGRFANKEALLVGIFERHRGHFASTFEQLCADIDAGGLTLRAALEKAMQAMVWLYRDNGALVRATNHAAQASPVLRRRMAAFNKAVCADLYRALSRYRKSIRHPQPMLAMKLGHEAGIRLLRAAILHDEIDCSDLAVAGIVATDALLAREAARLWEAYLRSAR